MPSLTKIQSEGKDIHSCIGTVVLEGMLYVDNIEILMNRYSKTYWREYCVWRECVSPHP